MDVLEYMNLLNGEYSKPVKINQWFSDFLTTFTKNIYYAQVDSLNPWTYKTLLDNAKRNHWNMLSTKQWSIFEKYIQFENTAYTMFANFKHKDKIFKISVSCTTGFVTIKISG